MTFVVLSNVQCLGLSDSPFPSNPEGTFFEATFDEPLQGRYGVSRVYWTFRTSTYANIKAAFYQNFALDIREAESNGYHVSEGKGQFIENPVTKIRPDGTTVTISNTQRLHGQSAGTVFLPCVSETPITTPDPNQPSSTDLLTFSVGLEDLGQVLTIVNKTLKLTCKLRTHVNAADIPSDEFMAMTLILKKL